MTNKVGEAGGATLPLTPRGVENKSAGQHEPRPNLPSDLVSLNLDAGTAATKAKGAQSPAQKLLEEQRSAMEAALRRLLTSVEFRRAFLTDPADALAAENLAALPPSLKRFLVSEESLETRRAIVAVTQRLELNATKEEWSRYQENIPRLVEQMTPETLEVLEASLKQKPVLAAKAVEDAIKTGQLVGVKPPGEICPGG